MEGSEYCLHEHFGGPRILAWERFAARAVVGGTSGGKLAAVEEKREEILGIRHGLEV